MMIVSWLRLVEFRFWVNLFRPAWDAVWNDVCRMRFFGGYLVSIILGNTTRWVLVLAVFCARCSIVVVLLVILLMVVFICARVNWRIGTELFLFGIVIMSNWVGDGSLIRV